MRGIFHSSPVLTAGWVKNWYCCAWLIHPSGIRLLLSVTPGWRWILVLFYAHSLLPCRIWDVQLNAEFHKTAIRVPFSSESIYTRKYYWPPKPNTTLYIPGNITDLQSLIPHYIYQEILLTSKAWYHMIYQETLLTVLAARDIPNTALSVPASFIIHRLIRKNPKQIYSFQLFYCQLRTIIL